MISHRPRSMMRGKSWREGRFERNEKEFAFTPPIFENKHVGAAHVSPHRSIQYWSTIRSTVQSNQTRDHNWRTADENIFEYTPSTSRYYHRDRRFRFCLFNVRSMLTWVQSHKCRLEEPANNISAAAKHTVLRKWVLCHSSSPSLDMKHLSSIKPV